jgi:hypothetical protein
MSEERKPSADQSLIMNWTTEGSASDDGTRRNLRHLSNQIYHVVPAIGHAWKEIFIQIYIYIYIMANWSYIFHENSAHLNILTCFVHSKNILLYTAAQPFFFWMNELLFHWELKTNATKWAETAEKRQKRLKTVS